MRRMPLPAELLALAANQHGLFTRDQSRPHGVDRHLLQRCVERGEVRRLSARVFAVSAAPSTELQLVLATVLDSGPGACASHHTALAMFGLPGYQLLPAHVLAPRTRSSRTTDLGVTHTSRWLRDHHTIELLGISVTSPTRTPFDVSWFVHPKKLELTIDRAASRRLTSYRLLHAMLDELARRGRPLTRLMRALLDERPPDFVPVESGLEARFQEIVRAGGITTLDRQVDTGDDTTWLGRMDFRDRVLAYVSQIDSDLYHAALVDKRRDEMQTAALRAAGFVVDRIPEFDVWHRRDRVLETVRRGLAEARARRLTQPASVPVQQ
jgi:hypothetical protein